MSCGQPTSLLGMTLSDWYLLIIGAVLGLLVTVLFQWLLSLHQRRLLQKAYAGTWNRRGMCEYGYTPDVWKQNNPQVFGKEVIVMVQTAKSIHLKVDYSDGRGIAEAIIELHGDGMTSGEGPYSYTKEGDDCYGHAGWYSLQRMTDGRLHVYFTGRYPENTARGYEVWERK